MYRTITWPDIAYVVQVIRQFVSAPRQLHLTAAHRISRYTEALVAKDSSSLQVHLNLKPLMMLIGQVAQIPADPLLDAASSLEFSYRDVKGNLLFPNLHGG